MTPHDVENILPAAQPRTPIAFDVPESACDCLTHIFGDPSQYPMSPGRTYTPPPASVEEIQAMLRGIHFSRVVIVQPTIYGTDNTCTVDAVQRLGSGARGMAVVDEQTTAAELDRLQAVGMCGVRINMETIGQADPAVARRRFKTAVTQVTDRPGWHIQMYLRPAMFDAIEDLLADCTVPVSLDHFAGFRASDGVAQPTFTKVLEFLRAGKIYVKLSAPYLASRAEPDFDDVTPLAQALIAANPERILWATNWPHPDSGKDAPRRPLGAVYPLRQPDDGRILNLLPRWAPDPSVRRLILVDNPARLFGF